MKSLILTALLLTAGTTYASTDFPVTGIETDATVERSEMQLDELPEGVIRTLDGARFTGWKPLAAYKVKTENASYYEITFVRGEEIEYLKLNEEGGKIG